MAKKHKPHRSMARVGQSQQITEKAAQSKFALAEDIAKGQRTEKAVSKAGRISPQLSCTIEPDDKAVLNELTLYLSNKVGRSLNTSNVIRALIRLGHKEKDKLEL